MSKTVRELLESMQAVELSALAISDYKPEDIPEKMLNKFIGITNMVLVDIYTKFNIKTNSVIIVTEIGRDTYALKDSEPNLLLSPDEVFPNDFITIKRILGEDGEWLPINDTSTDKSAYTPKPNMVQLPSNNESKAYEIVYQARHPKLSSVGALSVEDILNQEIELPLPLEEPLSTKIASYFFKGMAGEGNTERAKILSQDYEVSCALIKGNNTVEYESADYCMKLDIRNFP